MSIRDDVNFDGAKTAETGDDDAGLCEKRGPLSLNGLNRPAIFSSVKVYNFSLKNYSHKDSDVNKTGNRHSLFCGLQEYLEKAIGNVIL